METSIGIELDGQYRALREAAGVVERPDRRILRVGGREAGEYLQGQLTNDVEVLGEDEGCYSALLDRKGRMQGDMTVVKIADFFIVTEAIAADAVLRHLDTYRVGREVEVEDVSARLRVLSVIGPAAAELTRVDPLPPEHGHRKFVLPPVAGGAIATDLGVDLWVTPDEKDELHEELVAAGAAPVSEGAAEIVRVETGRPRFGKEMTTATIPEEAGINERAVSFSKGCYIGQETVARLHYKGKPNRALRGLRLSAPAVDGDPIRLAEREVGAVGTAVISPARGPLALAIVRREAEPGSRVEVGDDAEAEVVSLPFG